MHRPALRLLCLAGLGLVPLAAAPGAQQPLPASGRLARVAPPASPGPAFLRVQYGSEAPSYQVLNLYLTEGARHLVLWIPGGWGQLPLPAVEPDPESFLGRLRAEGFHVGHVSVRPSKNPGGPEWYWPDPQDDVAAAVAFVRGHATRFGVPIETVSFVGRSAGGVRALAAELSDPGERLFDALAEISACTDLTQLTPQGNAAAPYFGVAKHAEAPPQSLQAASAIPLVLANGLGNAPPLYLHSPNASQDPSNPHAAYYQVLFDTVLGGLGHPHVFVWTPGESLDPRHLAEWLRRVLE